MVIKKTTILAYLIVGMFLAAGIFPTITGQDEKDSGKATVTLIDEGFESGIPGSWINTGWVLNLYGFPHSGSNWAYTWSAGAELSIMALNFGENTELSFWYAAENSIEPMDLEVRIDDNAVWSDTGFTHTSYQQAVINLGSYSGDHTLSFIGLNDGFYGQSLDDILLTTEKDIEPPVISNVDATPPIQTVGQSVAISCDVTDNKGVDDVYVNITFPDTSENSYFMAGSGSYSYSQTYLQAGIHNYHIYAIDINGNSAESAIFSFEMNAPPVADFEYTPSSPTTADMVSFTDLSFDPDGTVVAWEWDFGDGGSSTVADPTHQFDDGSYLVSLTVTDDNDATDTCEETVMVLNIEPVADFEYAPSSPTTADMVSFTDLSFDPDGTIVAWEWNFDDGGSSTIADPTHQFDDGTYLITLTVWDDDSGTDVHTDTITVTNIAPTADFEYTPSNPTTADTVSFTDLSSDPDGTIVAWDWDFGDGGSSTVADPTYSYDDDGVYTITLTVWDDDSGTDVHTDTITVTNVGPTADFTYFPIEPSILDTVDFTDTSIDPDGTIVAWEWDFDDGDTSTMQNPSHQFTTSGQYSVSLTVWDDDDATDTIIIPIDITPPVEVEDVNQSLFDRGFPIRHTWDGDWGSAQSFDTDVTTLTSAQIYLRKFGTPEFNLTVEIRKDHPEGTLIESMEFDIDDIPSTWTWLTVDFENFTVNPTTTYFIVLPPAPSSVSTSFGYEWGYTFGDVYSDGAFWFTRDGGDLWRDLPTRYDFTFITMGYVVN